MIVYKNKEFRNLQEQVLENMKDIANLQEGTAVLSEFGIKVVGEVESVDDLPTVLEYKSDNPDWAYGDAYAIGTTSPYTLYILTRENDTHDEDYWFDIGVFPVPGPQGEQGVQGPIGPQGQTGPQGDSAGFGTVTATAETLSPGSSATVSVTTSGPNTAKEFAFTFGLPQGQSAAFVHYVTISASTIVGGQYTGTLTLTQYNTLYDNYDSIVVLNSTSSLANNKYFLKKWYTSDDYLVYIGVWSLNNNDTRYYLLKVDRSNRNWTLDVGQPIKITSYNINSASATAGQVLTADGSGGASWQDGGNGVEIVTLTQSVSTLSDDDYDKLNGDNAIIKFVSSADGWTKYFKKYKDDGTYIYYYQVSQEDGSGTFFGGFRIVKSTKYCASLNSYLKVSTSNINSGSTIANQYLTSNGSGGTSWTSGPSQVQSDWNESSQSSPAFIKNKPTIPTVPVTDVTVNGTSVMDGTTAKVLVDTVDGVTDGTNWTSLTVNGTTAGIPAGGGTATDVQINGTSIVSSGVANIVTEGTYDATTNKIATMADIPSATNMVTTDTNQRITGTKTFDGGGLSAMQTKPLIVATSKTYEDKGLILTDGFSRIANGQVPYSYDTGRIYYDRSGNDSSVITIVPRRSSSETTYPYFSFENATGSYDNMNPRFAMLSDDQADLGYTNRRWKDLFLSGKISDGTNNITVANMVNKVNSVVPITETWTFTLSDNTVVTKTVVTDIFVS